jgi:hypothetical protein
MTDFGYNEQSLSVCNGEFLRDFEALRRFPSEKTIYDKKEPQYKNLYVITL